MTPKQVFRPVDLGRLRVRPQPSPRDSFPLVTCGFLQRKTKGRPSGRLHSDAQVSQQEKPKNSAPPYRSTVYGTLKVVKRELCLVYIFSFWPKSFPSPLCVTSRLEQATRVFLEISQKFKPRFQHSKRYLSYPRIQSALKRI